MEHSQDELVREIRDWSILAEVSIEFNDIEMANRVIDKLINELTDKFKKKEMMNLFVRKYLSN